MSASIFVVLCLFVVPSFQNENPDVHLSTPEIIRRHGYLSETHTIETTDGYLLNVHRIPGKTFKKPGPVVFLQHGLLSSSADWIINGPENALGFLLAEKGYDVWMGNARGNSYSRSHITLNPDDSQFWKFSWDEMAQLDLPAVIDYIVNVTNKEKITYIGHSMGTTLFFALMSAIPEYNDKISLMIALAPVTSVKYIRSPLRILSPWVHDLEFLQKLIGFGEFLPQNKLLQILSKYLCDDTNIGKDVCENLMFVFAGYDKEQLTDEMLPVIISHAPAGTSSLTAIQFAQQIQSGRFCRFDYGESVNMQKYNATLPPLYETTAVRVPVAIFYADNDLFVSAQDLKILTDRLPHIIETYQVPYKKFNHIDFMYAKDASKLVYNRVMQIVSNITVPMYDTIQIA